MAVSDLIGEKTECRQPLLTSTKDRQGYCLRSGEIDTGVLNDVCATVCLVYYCMFLCTCV